MIKPGFRVSLPSGGVPLSGIPLGGIHRGGPRRVHARPGRGPHFWQLIPNSAV
ncbi:MAG: hypothetical protein WA958_04575 [Tunicatimonas sp.]